MNHAPRNQHVAKDSDAVLLRVAKVQTFAGGRALTNATGFFYLHNDFLYLVTARHVVINEAYNHRPDHLQLSLHCDEEDLQQRDDISIPLYVCGPACRAQRAVQVNVNHGGNCLVSTRHRWMFLIETQTKTNGLL